MTKIVQPSDYLVHELRVITAAKAQAMEQRFPDHCSVKTEFDRVPDGRWSARIEYHCAKRTWFEIYEYQRPSSQPSHWVCTRYMDD